MDTLLLNFKDSSALLVPVWSSSASCGAGLANGIRETEGQAAQATSPRSLE